MIAPPDPETETQGAVACTVCGSENPLPFLRPPRSPGPVVLCGRCGMVYVSPRQDSSAIIEDGQNFTDHEALRRSEDLADLDGCWELGGLDESPAMLAARRYNYAAALNWIEAAAPPGRRLLDFGAGWGYFLDSARSMGWQVTGLEPLPGHGVYARGKLGLNVVSDTLRPDTFAPGSFDVVTAFQVFEHLPDPAGELRKIHRLLVPGGLVVIEVPNIDTPWLRLMRGAHRHFVIDHLWFFGPDTLARFLHDHGFDPVDKHFPSRRLPVSHLTHFWLGRYLPPGLVRAVERILRHARLLDRRVSVNLHDIILVIGRKRR